MRRSRARRRRALGGSSWFLPDSGLLQVLDWDYDWDWSWDLSCETGSAVLEPGAGGGGQAASFQGNSGEQDPGVPRKLDGPVREVGDREEPVATVEREHLRAEVPPRQRAGPEVGQVAAQP